MSGNQFGDTRTVQSIGDSVGITLQKSALEALGIEPEELTGTDIPVSIDTETGEFSGQLPSDSM